MDIYVYMQGQRRGPYGKAQLEEMWKRAQIPRDTLCWHKGLSRWTLISDLFADTGLVPSLGSDVGNVESATFPVAS